MRNPLSNLNPFKSNIPLIGGLLSALLFIVLSLFGGPLLAVLAQVPLWIIGALKITNQRPYGLLLIGLTLLITLLLGIGNGLIYGMLVAMPVFILLPRALQFKQQDNQIYWYPQHLLLTDLSFYALALGLLTWIGWEIADFKTATWQVVWMQLTTVLKFNLAEQQLLEEYFKTLWPYLPGLLAAGFLLMTTWSAALTQRWLKRHQKTLPRQALALTTLNLPWWCWQGLAASAVAWMIATQMHTPTASFLGVILLVFVSLFVLQGLAIFHTFVKKRQISHLFLVIFYICVIVFAYPLFLLIVVGAGVLEPWLNLRDRINKKHELKR
jgi:hypothetical protein